MLKNATYSHTNQILYKNKTIKIGEADSEEFNHKHVDSILIF